MAPSVNSLVVQLRQLIFYHLDNESLDNANFLAGRLLTLDAHNPDSAHLLALTYVRMRRCKAAYDTAKEHGAAGRHLGCSYVFALACETLGRFKEGINAMEKAKALWMGLDNWNKHSEISRRHMPDASSVWNLLGKLSRKHGDLQKSGEYFLQSHRSNPFVWDSFKGLCEIGANFDTATCFALTAKMTENASDALDATADSGDGNSGSVDALDPFTSMPTKTSNDWAFQFSKIKSKGIFGSPPKVPASQALWETPTGTGNLMDDDIDMIGFVNDNHTVADGGGPPPIRRSKTLSKLGFDTSKEVKSQLANLKSIGRSQSETTEREASTLQSERMPGVHKRTHSGHTSNAPSDTSTLQLRRSNRLFGQFAASKSSSKGNQDVTAAKRDADAKKAKATSVKPRGTSTVGRVVSGNRKMLPPTGPPADGKESRASSRNDNFATTNGIQKPQSNSIILVDTAPLEALLSMLKPLGLGYYALCRYNCKQAIKIFDSISPARRETAWVLAQLGKAHYECAEYSKAEECFSRMMKVDPSNIIDTEYYSTVLWQLKKPVQLAFLAHSLKEADFESPQTWCAVGNAFSLNREHEQAIGCFKRATQIDPEFAYAWTLMGHELLTNEEFDAALAAYRKGVGGERRGYASWYGLGKCYERMGKYEEAERHYRIAASINKENSVLFVCIGVVLERMRHPREALAQYTHAITLAPASALARFRRARTLMTLRIFTDALNELNELLSIAPDEANVWYMLGRCYKALGSRVEAVKCFTTSLNLDVKAAQHIKDAMEAIDDSDDEEEDDGE